MRPHICSTAFLLFRVTVAVALLDGCGIALAQQAQLTSFETLPGNEPTMHLSDPDLGTELDWFRVAPGKWAIRYQDGFLIPLHETGNVTLEGNSYIKVAADVDGKAEYAVPSAIADGASIYFRADSTQAFAKSSQLSLMEPDNVVAGANVSVSASLSQARDKILNVIPTHIDETGSPQANDYRWAFDADMNMLPQPGTLDRGRAITLQNGLVQISQSYHGDIETKRTFGGCHLKPVYLRAYLYFKASAAQQGDDIVIKPEGTHVEVGLLPHSDTGCGFINFDVSSIITRVLNTQGVQSGVSCAMAKVDLSLPLRDIEARFNNVISKDLPGFGQACIYLNPGEVTAPWLNGSFDQATASFGLTLRPRVFVAPTCPTTAAPPQMVQRPASLMREAPSLVFEMPMTYAQLRDALLQNPTIQNAGITDITFDPAVASVIAHLKKSGAPDILVTVVPGMALPEREGEIAIAWHFASSGGMASGLPDLSGTYVQDITPQADAVMSQLSGTYHMGNVTVSIAGARIHRNVITFAPDGIHSYLGIVAMFNGQLSN